MMIFFNKALTSMHSVLLLVNICQLLFCNFEKISNIFIFVSGSLLQSLLPNTQHRAHGAVLILDNMLNCYLLRLMGILIIKFLNWF